MMLTKGDLVKIRQDTFLYALSSEPWSTIRLKQPEFGVVIGHHGNWEIKILFENQTWAVSDKCLQLIGERDVRKTTQSQ